MAAKTADCDVNLVDLSAVAFEEPKGKSWLMLSPAGVILTPLPDEWSCWSTLSKALLSSVAQVGPAVTDTSGSVMAILGVVVVIVDPLEE